MADEVSTFRGGEEGERGGHQRTDLVKGPWTRRAKERLQFGDGEFDRIEVGTVGRKKPELRADVFDRGAHRRLFVHGEVVEHHDIAGTERGREDLLDIGEKAGIVDGPVEDGGRGEPVEPERRDDRVCVPVSKRGVIAQARAARAPAVAPQ